MAPITSTDANPSSVPLADYFFIAGIESSQVYESRANGVKSPPPVETTIEEDRALDIEAEVGPRPSTPGSPTPDAKRRSRYSFEARKSIGSIISPGDYGGNGTASNRSSAATIKPLGGISGLTDEDFEQALKKFASERDSFLEEIHVSAGTVVPQSKPTKNKPRTTRIKNTDDQAQSAGGLRNGVGSLRRKMSAMNSLKRQPSTQQASIRTSKRMSGYNSVIPTPQPFQSSPDMHPLKRRYEPVLLDRYPPKAEIDQTKKRCDFPDYVPMFAFPNDIHVVSSDERPRSTWHGFAMTIGNGSKLQGICVTIWLPLNPAASENLEGQCEAWRKANMSDEERELASSLGERLAAERAKLSRLLTQLPTVDSGSEEREILAEEIGAVEEKITLMTDLLRPVRHGAASKIDGLTVGDTGLWIPRVYGVLGRDLNLTSFWKEWLKAVIVPMTNGGILNVPPSSPKTGMWQPLERYVVNLCVEAPSPMSSITQVEVGIRELRLYARKEAANELPGSRNTDLYALFRTLSIPNIVLLFEYALAESRIILLSAHTSMLHLASAALASLLYPLKWTGVFIPVLPARLLQAVEAPCPYIVGVEKRYDNLELPDDDFVLVDLDQDTIESTAAPMMLPRQQRRKLTSLLQAAAPHHNRFGVQQGPPQYAVETFPNDLSCSENPQVYSQKAQPTTLANHVTMSSTAFGEVQQPQQRSAVYNAFLQARNDNSRGKDRPTTSSTTKGSQNSSTHSPPSPTMPSPLSSSYPNTPVSRNDSGFGLQAALREKRSGHFDSSRRSSSFGFDRVNPMRRPSIPFVSHTSNMSTSTINGNGAKPGYAPSTYAPSTLAASTIMPSVLMQPVRDTETTKWVEGHCMVWRPKDDTTCTTCAEKCDEGLYRCTSCPVVAHPRCVEQISLPCPAAFSADLVRAAFVRCFASLLITYRRHLHSASGDRKKSGLIYHFNMDAFVRSVPSENAEYMNMLRQSQAFNEFIHERESIRAEDPSIKLFDEIILSKRNRGKASFFSKSTTSFLSDSSDHLWRSAAAAPPNSRFPGDYRQIVTRIPAQLDTTLMKEPRAMQGAPRVSQAKTKRKPIPSMLGLAINNSGVE